MRPYYEESGITIYHGDCYNILPLLDEKVDLVLADPPYGISYSPGGGGKGWHPNGKTFTGKDIVIGDSLPFDPSNLLKFPHLILWGGNHYADKLPASPSWLVWYKRPGFSPIDFADCELAWTNIGGPARVFMYLWNGLMRAGERGVHYHPTQKPSALMNWCLSMAPQANMVLDPFMGSGTTLVAAKQLGRRAIGIEIEKKYCDIAIQRLKSTQRPLIPFTVAKPKAAKRLI